MGKLINVINNIQESGKRIYIEKNVKNMTKIELRKALYSTQLSDATLDYIAELFKVDLTKNPDGFEFKPIENSLSPKQNTLRMLIGDFEHHDVVKDKQNCMTYTYNNYSHRFDGKLDESEMLSQHKNGKDITIPPLLFNHKISLRNAFRNISSLTTAPKIQSINVTIDDMFTDSGLTEIPDFSHCTPDTAMFDSGDSWVDRGYDGSPNIAKAVIETLNSCTNITPQTKFDFVIKHLYDDPNNINFKIAHELSKEYFEISSNNFISKQEYDTIQGIINLTKPETDTFDKIAYLVSFNSCNIVKNEPSLFKKEIYLIINDELGLDERSIYSQYLQSFPPNKINAFSTIIVDANKREQPIYSLQVDDKFFEYSPTLNTIKPCLLPKFDSELVSDNEKNNVLQMLQGNFKGIADDILNDGCNNGQSITPTQTNGEMDLENQNYDEPCF